MHKKRTTIRDIARVAGVSVTAVSYAFNRPEEISPDLRERILRLAAEHGYRADPRARGLRTGESWLIALLVSQLKNAYFAELASAVQQVIEPRGYRLVLLECGSDESERRSLEAVRHEHMAGVIANAYYLSVEELRTCIGECPAVLIVDADTSCVGPSVRVPNFSAGYAATRHLLGLGRRRIAHISAPLDSISGMRRCDGYLRAIDEAGHEPILQVADDYAYAGGRRAMEQLLRAPTPPDAVFAANDMVALGAIAVLRERGISVPEQIAILGFDNIDAAEWSFPALTTVNHPANQIGTTAADLLLATIGDPSTNDIVDVTCEIIVRSTA